MRAAQADSPKACVHIFHVGLSLFNWIQYRLWQYGLWSFQTGDTKLERFLPKNQHYSAQDTMKVHSCREFIKD